MSNQNPKLTLDFNIEDIPWLLHAMYIQRNTALMYGREGDKTKARVAEYVEKIKEFYPVLASREIEEYKFFDAIMEIYGCKTWSIYQKKPTYAYEIERGYWREPIIIVCDDKPYPITSTLTNYDESLVLGLIELCKQISPITAEYIEHESIAKPILDNPSWYREQKG